MLLPGLGLKLSLTGGSIVGGIALVTGAATGGSHQTALATRPDTIVAICGYATATPSERTSPPSAPRPRGTDGDQRSQAGRDTRALAALGLNAKQQGNAAIIISTASAEGMPRRAAVIAVATALQESDLGLNLVGDHGTSFGLFHQKPTSGYGTREQILNARHAARSFFSRLRKVRHWETLPLTDAAQTVQKSRHPDAYVTHEDRAEKIVNAVGFEPSAARAALSPVTTGSTDRPPLSADQRAELRSTVLIAAAENLPPDDAISKITVSLQETGTPTGSEPEEKASGRGDKDDGDLRAAVAKEFQAAAEHYCTQLATGNEDAVAPLALDGSSRGAIAVAAAMKMIGVPYSWGGGGPTGPSRGIAHGANIVGFDCSGLTEYAWAKAGVRIGGTTDPQWRSGTRVPRSRLRPGDLLFFAHDPKNPATIHHVGINIDGTRMIHSPQTGRTVEITRWSGVPYREREFIGAVRPGIVGSQPR